MKPTTMMVAVGLLVAACGDTKSDIKDAVRELASENAADMKQQSYVNSMKSDLRNLMTAEEMYFTEHGKYTTNVKSLVGLNDPTEAPFPTPGNSLSPITLVGGGWTATIKSSNTPQVCAIFVETKTPIPPATIEGTPACG